MSWWRNLSAALLLAFAAVPAFAGPAQDVIRDPSLPQDAKGLDFEIGRALFERQWAAAPSSTQAADGLGPLFNARACASCHPGGGRGVPFDKVGAPLPALLFRLGAHATETTEAGDPVYGQQIQVGSVAGLAAEAKATVRFESSTVTLADGTAVELRKPAPQLDNLTYGPLAKRTVISPRLATAMQGMGLLEQIPEQEILELADPDDRNHDGISGRPNMFVDPVTGETAIGRFGWKASQPTLERQDAKALDLDIGLANPIFQNAYGDCTAAEADCLKMPTGASPQFENLEVPSSLTRLIDRFVTEAVLPTAANAASLEASPPPGLALFAQAGCESCHRLLFELPTAANQPKRPIFPFTDLLLHDMGPGLADHMMEGEASGREWRTAPLWGIGQALRADNVGLLHDGRARNVLEAILWHDGEAAGSREIVEQYPARERQALIDFIGSL